MEATEHLKAAVNKEVELDEGIMIQPEDTKTAERILKMDIYWAKMKSKASARLSYSAFNRGKNVNIVDREMENYLRATVKSVSRLSRVASRRPLLSQ
ncbi:hypothetical protein C5167_033123 [Papaver somniferum]|uniref:Uncharacterized protein n=1 Tax=Papaver somniferum TaxID=3469 RepID=A0A4Y7K9A6_PAPSO|nr:hypothetical protein C5167_033123 [Papaver somniferum]